MRLIPAIDILNAKVVRLHQGNYADSVEYSNSPLEQLAIYAMHGAGLVHIVDLDAAKSGKFTNDKLIHELLETANINLQIAGGIRSKKDLQHRLDMGIHRVVIGSYIISHTSEFCNILDTYDRERLVAAVDVRQNESGDYIPQVKGWTEAANICLFDLLDRLTRHGLKHLLCTDISKDGMLSGPNYELYADIQKRYPALIVQASGGVSSLDDLKQLADLGIRETISGKALLDGRIDMQVALQKYSA
jgi:phosphoribosylformimino-5-aminoimidazole carboxamide ribotide isomerase